MLLTLSIKLSSVICHLSVASSVYLSASILLCFCLIKSRNLSCSPLLKVHCRLDLSSCPFSFSFFFFFIYFLSNTYDIAIIHPTYNRLQLLRASVHLFKEVTVHSANAALLRNTENIWPNVRQPRQTSGITWSCAMQSERAPFALRVRNPNDPNAWSHLGCIPL